MFYFDEVLVSKYVQQQPWGSSAGSLLVYIPDLMPLIGMGIPRTTSTSLNKSCYSNASDCKPSVSGSARVQNYVTAEAPYHEYKLPLYAFGSEIAVNVKGFDCPTCRLTPEEIDNSFIL